MFLTAFVTTFLVGSVFPPGTLDTSFGGGGTVALDILDGDTEEFARAVDATPDGKLIVGGLAGDDVLLLRLDENGAPDTTFGVGGVVVTDFGARDAIADIALLPDGRIIVAGTTWDATMCAFLVARYHADGTLDLSFGRGGYTLTPLDLGCGGSGIALATDGRIVVAGRANANTHPDLPGGGLALSALAMYLPDGTIEPSFGADGLAMVTGTQLSDVAIQADGKIVAAGSTPLDYSLCRLTPNGDLDSEFGEGGSVLTSSSASPVAGLEVQSDGKIVLALTSGLQPMVRRYQPNGTLDGSFANSGVATPRVPDVTWASGIAIQGNGKIVLTATNQTLDDMSQERFAVLRLNDTGWLDTTFGEFGIVTTDFGVPDVARATTVVIEPDGDIVVAGALSGSCPRFCRIPLARYIGDSTGLVASIRITGQPIFDVILTIPSFLPVAILSDASFNAADVDPSSVRFGPGGAQYGGATPSLRDVDGDGDMDLQMEFWRADAQIACNSRWAGLRGQTHAGEEFQGGQLIRALCFTCSTTFETTAEGPRLTFEIGAPKAATWELWSWDSASRSWTRLWSLAIPVVEPPVRFSVPAVIRSPSLFASTLGGIPWGLVCIDYETAYPP